MRTYRVAIYRIALLVTQGFATLAAVIIILKILHPITLNLPTLKPAVINLQRRTMNSINFGCQAASFKFPAREIVRNGIIVK